MADYQIDELSLKIDIQGASKKNADNIRDIASAIRSLNKAVSNSGALNNLKAYSKNLQKLAGSIRSSFADIKSGTAAGSVTPKMTDVGGGRTNKKITDKLPSKDLVNITDKDAYATERFQLAIDRLNGSMNMTKEESRALAEQFGKIVDETDNVSNAVKKSTSTWSKFTKSIGRIAMYRAIRSVLKSITQAMIEGVQNYAKYSETTNKAISNIRNSIQQIKDTFGVTFGYLLETLEPVITSLSDKIVELVNNVNMALASLKGDDEYKKAIKRNTDYAKSLDKVNSKLLSFDKFETLGSEEKTDFMPEDLPDELPDTAQAFKSIFEIVQDIADLVKEIWEYAKPLIEEWIPMLKPLLSSIAKLVKTLLPLVKKISEISMEQSEAVLPIIVDAIESITVALDLLMPVLEWLVDILKVIFDLGTTIFRNMSSAFKIIKGLLLIFTGDFNGAFASIKDGFGKLINSLINMFVSFINFFIQGINLLIKPIDMLVGAIGGIFGKNWRVKIPNIPKVDLNLFANGGVPETGTMFYAGEAGAEIVTTSRSGQTGVANVEQISQAMLQALINYNAAQNGQSGGGNVYLDSRQVGQLVEDSVYREGVRVGHFKRA